MTYFTRSKNIGEVVSEAFERIRKDVRMNFTVGYDPELTKPLLQDALPRLLVSAAEKLIDTTFNYLMDDALEILKDKDVSIKNALYEYDFRNIKKTFDINPESLTFTWAPSKLLCGAAAGGTVAVVGVGASYYAGTAMYAKLATAAGWTSRFAFTGILVGLAGGIVALALAALAFKRGGDAILPLSRQRLEEDVEQFISDQQKNVGLWLDSLVLEFQREFKEFCEQHDVQMEGLV